MSERFWDQTDKIERDFVGDCDIVRFRRRMKRIGHQSDVIEDRLAELRKENHA